MCKRVVLILGNSPLFVILVGPALSRPSAAISPLSFSSYPPSTGFSLSLSLSLSLCLYPSTPFQQTPKVSFVAPSFPVLHSHPLSQSLVFSRLLFFVHSPPYYTYPCPRIFEPPYPVTRCSSTIANFFFSCALTSLCLPLLVPEHKLYETYMCTYMWTRCGLALEYSISFS